VKSIDLIRWALEFTGGGTAQLVRGLERDYMTRPTPGAKGGGGNHVLWSLGHLAAIEGSLRHIVAGEPNPVGHWWPLFGTGTQPTDDPGVYPPFAEVLAAYHECRAYNVGLLERIGEAGLDAVPPHVPAGLEEGMTSIGQTFLLVALHNMVHYGQICDARRVAGLRPLM
jgi:hypothetical protein